ncbi:MAG: chromosome segregation protein SMC [candidate division FCPU426 bacterium]
MHFKRLEMQGFKSFVDHTCLDFEPGISSIIGPNGCGKSNVVDALRWVLGEQSAKALRGSRMEDVIFNGTDQRKAVGMAEVTLTIDNHDRLLRSDQDEIMVTRRNYRSGESEYLINKVPCRLRDIHDLFMDTGIGTNAYSILEQGKIDLIVSSRPADRRFVFEEAAGISKYKSRKEESLRKLEATDQNFLRVNDIAVEVRRQINSLERQVQKARRYQELKQELTTLEVAQGRRELRRLKREVGQVERQWEACRLQLEQNEHQQRHLSEELNRLTAELTAAENQASELQTAWQRVTEETVKTEEFLTSSALRGQDLHAESERLAEETSHIGTRLEECRRQRGELEANQQQKRGERERESRELEAAEERLRQLEQELKTKVQTVQESQTRLLHIVDELTQWRGALQNLSGRQGELVQQRDRLQQQLGTLAGQSRDILGEKNRLTEEQGKIRGTLEALRAERAHLEAEQERVEQVLSTLNAMQDNFNTTQTQLKSRLSWIEELQNGLEGYEAGTKAVLLEHNAHPEKLPGVLGPVAAFMRTEQKYELALEAFLGQKLQHILVENEAQAFAVMAFLAEDNRGRATVIPLEKMNTRGESSMFTLDEEPSWLKIPGVVGWAKSLVKIDERFRMLFDLLLDQVALVENRDVALQVRAAGARCTLVTLAGELHGQEGWLTGGSTELRERGFLGRERECEELRLQISLLAVNQQKTQAEIDNTRRQLEEITGGLSALRGDIHEQEILDAQLEKSLELVEAQLQDVERQSGTWGGEFQVLEEALRQIESERQEAERRVREGGEAEQGTQEQLLREQADIEHLRQEFEQRSYQAGTLRVAVAAREEQLRALGAEGERLAGEIADLTRQQTEKQSLCEHTRSRLAEIQVQREEREGWLQALAGRRGDLEENVSRVRSQREQLRSEKETRDQEWRALHTVLDRLRSESHGYDLDKTRRRMELQTLETYLEQEYRLNLSLETEPGQEETETAETQPAAERVEELKSKLAAMGAVNLVAVEEYDELQQRYTFLSQQLEDLKASKEKLQRLITRINQESRERFSTTFTAVREKFKEVFRRLFNGGEADLVLVDELDLLETGIEIIARPPGKRLQHISLLSGGEKALTAIALLFAIYLIKPSPFCIFDEMDAPLDDANTLRFCKILKDFAKLSQFIVITHNKLTMETADILFGVTMQESGVSRLISVKFKGEEQAREVRETTPSNSEEMALN